MGFAIDHAVGLLNGRAADRLGEVALAGAGRPQGEHVLPLRDEQYSRLNLGPLTGSVAPARRPGFSQIGRV